MDVERIDNTAGEFPAELDEHFQGRARLQRLPNRLAEGPAIFAVHFEPGGRTKPHVHPAGQVLIVVAGEGMVGSRSGRQVVRAGDVVAAGPGEWHWHGGTPTSPMTHVTVQQPGPDSVDWDVDEGDWASDYGD